MRTVTTITPTHLMAGYTRGLWDSATLMGEEGNTRN